jgi:hypothetical protein
MWQVVHNSHSRVNSPALATDSLQRLWQGAHMRKG